MIDLKNHYGFTRTPFGKDLAPSMLCRYPAHSEAVARITWCARERALGRHHRRSRLREDRRRPRRDRRARPDPPHAHLPPRPDHRHTAASTTTWSPRSASGPPTAPPSSPPRPHRSIAAEHGERGRVPLLVIDEAHLLTHAQLEAVRILTNSEMDAASPLACLLIGQPTLRRMLRLGVLAALDQRIGLRYAMPAMTAEQTAGYITHHLQLAGRSDTIFSDDAMTLVHDAARGLPRAVNNIATQALVAAMAARKNIVDEQSARAAVNEITSD